MTADKAEALMCATGEKVAYGGHQSRLGRSARFDPKAAERAKPGLGHGVNGSRLSRGYRTRAASVGAAMCSASHDGSPVNGFRVCDPR